MPPGGMGLERCLQSSLVTFGEYFFEELEFEEEDDEEMIGSESLHEIEVIIIIIIMDSTAATQRASLSWFQEIEHYFLHSVQGC